jgi:type II secretory ATPase GspE/PulE/Tfp pilus assembly ATPase PilB-like protein
MLAVAMKEGMTTLVQDGIEKVLKGVTTLKQVRAVALK